MCHVSHIGEDIRAFDDHRLSPDSSNFTFRHLNLSPGQRYFCSVRAYNRAGLHSTQSSDGFIVDNIPPSSGLVYDGVGMDTVPMVIALFYVVLYVKSGQTRLKHKLDHLPDLMLGN